MACAAMSVLVVIYVLCCVVRPSSPAAMCPPLHSDTVQVQCLQGSEPLNCTALPSPPGTLAKFQCRALHQPLFGFPPPAGFESSCGSNGEWSVRPFRCVPICGRPTGRPSALVRDGEVVTSAADYPWHVTVYDLTLDLKQICGGSLVTTKFFISAAHCFHDNVRPLSALRFMAGFAKTKRSVLATEPQEQFRPVAKIHMKDYGAKKLHYVNDIALAELENEVAVTAWTLPVCVDWALDQPDLRDGEEGTVVGFGNTALEASEALRFAKLPFVRGDVCKKLVDDKLAIFTLLPDKFCVGFVNNTSVAHGDSGGGLAFPNADRTWFLRGVVSVGSSKGTTYSYFTNVTTFVPWISGIIRKGELSGRRCGVDVALSSVVDGATADRQDFPWEVDVYFKRTSTRAFERLWSGVLVKPNLVITAWQGYSSVADERLVFASEIPASLLRVASQRNAASSLWLDETLGNVSEVVRLLHPTDLYTKAGVLYTFALMELKQPMHLMPVCVDWTGGAQLKTRPEGVAFFETPANNTRTWKRFLALNTTNKCETSWGLPSRYFCATHQGKEPRHRSRSLLVNVDDSWYLRGMWFYSNGSQAVFTDMGDAGVQRWLDTAKDQLGQPTCGNINLCEPLTALAALPGHMPWNVAVADGEGYVAGAGLLVHPKAVLTSSVVLQAATGWDDKSLFPAEDSANIVVLFTEPNGTSRNASVVRVSVQQTSKDRGSSSRNVVLLELAAEDAVFSTPVCLDLTGKVLQQLSPGQLGLVESWSEWQPANHSLIGAPFVSSADCYRRTTYKRNLLSKEVFCSEAMKGTIGPMTRGGGYVVSTGSQWFLQGLYLEHLAVRRTDLMVAKDLRDEEVRTWLQRELHKVETLEEYRLIDTGPKTCEGGRPSVSQCGKFASVDENTEDAGFDILGRATFDHMQWNVKVDVDYGVEGWSVRGGALVKRNMVLTSAHRLVLAAGSNTTVRLIPTSDLVVYYTSIDIRDGLSAEVDRIHVKARPARRPVEFDLALLVLTTALDLTPVCLPAPGTLVGTMPRLAAGSVGLVEFSVHVRAHRNWLIPVYYLRSGGCKNRLNETNGTEDEFCAETTVMGLEADADIPVLGYGLSVRGVDGLWYLRSVLSGQSQLTVLSFINLDDPGVLQWLAAKTRDAISDDQDDEQAEELTAANATTTPNTSSTPTTSTPKSLPSTLGNSSSLKCGQTSLPLNQLTTAGQKLYGHIPWTVGVFRARAEGGPGVIVGVLVREDMVLTDGASLLVPGDGLNHTGDVQTVDVGQMFVAWVGPTGKRNFVLVAALHVYERDRRSSQTSGVGVALLVLKTPITNSVVPCLDWDGDAPALPAIATGAIGVVETWRGSFFTDRRVLVALSALGAADCRTRLAGRLPSKDSIAEDMFCTGDSSETIETGAPFLVQRGGSWFLRGIYSFPITRVANRALVFVDLNDASVRKWLREKIRTAHANSSDTTASIQDVVLNAYRGDNFNGYTHL